VVLIRVFWPAASFRTNPSAVNSSSARSVLAWQHAGLSAVCSRISFESSFYPLKRRLSGREIGECGRLFGFLESVLANGEGPFLFSRASLADFALAPTVIRLSRHNAPTKSFPRVGAWMRAVLTHSLVGEWMAEADALPHIWFDDYLPGEVWPDAFECEAAQ